MTFKFNLNWAKCRHKISKWQALQVQNNPKTQQQPEQSWTCHSVPALQACASHKAPVISHLKHNLTAC